MQIIPGNARRHTFALFQRVAIGQLLSSRFFRRHLFTTGVVVLLCFFAISVRFDCTTSMQTINRLRHEIEVMRTYKQSERSRYMTLTRESSMQHKVDSLRLGLSVPEQRPLTIPYTDATHEQH